MRVGGGWGEVKEACGGTPLCVGLEAGTDSAVHAVKFVWKEDEQDEEWWGFF